MDFKIRDVANKHLKFRGKVRAGDTKLDCCSLIDWSKMGSNHVKTEVSVKFETFQDKDLLFTHSSTHTDYVYYLECVSSIILCVFINAAPFISILSFIFYTQLNHCFLLNVFCDAHRIYSYILTLRHCVNLMELHTCVRICLFVFVLYHITDVKQTKGATMP